MATKRHSIRQIFLLPALIALIVTFGLFSALLGDGIWDAASWVALAIPLGLLVFFLGKNFW
jgi:hypothetical protein